MAKKYKIKKVLGVKVAVKLEKDKNRPEYPKPSIGHQDLKKYDRKRAKEEERKLRRESNDY